MEKKIKNQTEKRPPIGEAVENLAAAFAAEEDNAAAWRVVRPKGKKKQGTKTERKQPTAGTPTVGNPSTQASQASVGKLTKSQKYRLKQKRKREEARGSKPKEPTPAAEGSKGNAPGPSFFFKTRKNGKEPTSTPVAPPANSEDLSAVVAGAEGRSKKCGSKPKTTPLNSNAPSTSSADPSVVAAVGTLAVKGYQYRHKRDNRFNRKKRAAIETSRSAQASAHNEPHKRTRLDDTVSPRERKKAKLDSSRRNTTSYADIVQNELCVAVVREDGKQLSEEQATKVKGYLNSKILEDVMDPNNDFAPNFRGKPIIGDGALKLWCENVESLKWLKQALDKIPVTTGPKLVVKKQAELTRRVRAALFLPDCETTVVQTSLVLAMQNKWALVPSWTVYSHTAQEGSLFLTLGIPESVVPILLKNERRLGHNLGNVYVRFFAADGTLQDEPPISVDKESALIAEEQQPGPSTTELKAGTPAESGTTGTTPIIPSHSSPKPSGSRETADEMKMDAEPRTDDWRQAEEMLDVSEDEDEGNHHDGDPDILDLV